MGVNKSARRVMSAASRQARPTWQARDGTQPCGRAGEAAHLRSRGAAGRALGPLLSPSRLRWGAEQGHRGQRLLTCGYRWLWRAGRACKPFQILVKILQARQQCQSGLDKKAASRPAGPLACRPPPPAPTPVCSRLRRSMSASASAAVFFCSRRSMPARKPRPNSRLASAGWHPRGSPGSR